MNQSILRLGFCGLLAFAIAGTPAGAQAQNTSADTTTNAVKTVKHKKKKIADSNAPAATAPVTTPASPPSTQSTATETTHSKSGHNKSGILPFHGNLKAVDAAAKTISVGTRTFVVTSETIIIKDGKPATVADGKVGETASGAFKQGEDGKLLLTKLRFGAKSAVEASAPK